MSGAQQHVDDLSCRISGARFEMHGLHERWAAPLAVIDAPLGFGEEIWDWRPRETLIAWVLAGGNVISEVREARGAFATEASAILNLQVAHDDSHYRSTGPVRFGQFYLGDGLLRRVGEGFDRPGLSQRQLRNDLLMFDDGELHRRLARYAACHADPAAPPSRIEAEARSLLVAEHLIGRYHLGRVARPAQGGLAPWQLRRVTDHLRGTISGDVTLDELAALVGLSTFHFARMFKHSAGVPPHAYLRALRADRARELLATTDLSIVEIALEVGYESSQALARAFRRDIGVSPSAFRRQRRG